MTVRPLPHHRRLMRDPEASPLYRWPLLAIMAAGIGVLLYTGGVFGHMREALERAPRDPHVQLGEQIVQPINPLECTPTAQHRAVITIEQLPDGRASAWCKRYLIARPAGRTRL